MERKEPLSTRPTICPNYFIPEHITENSIPYPREICILMFIEVLLRIEKNWNQLHCPSPDKQIMENIFIHVLLNCKEK